MEKKNEAIVHGYCEGRHVDAGEIATCKRVFSRKDVKFLVSTEENDWHRNWYGFKGAAWKATCELLRDPLEREYTYHKVLGSERRMHFGQHEKDTETKTTPSLTSLTWILRHPKGCSRT